MYEDIHGIFSSVLSLKLRTPVWCTVVFGGFTVGGLTAWIDNWVYNPYSTYLAIIGLITTDHLTGMAIAWQNNKFETRKALRIFWTICSHTALLMFASNIAKGNPALFWLDEALVVPVALVSLLSLIKNLALLGFVKSEIADLLYRKIDVYKNEYVEKPAENRPMGDTPVNGC